MSLTWCKEACSLSFLLGGGFQVWCIRVVSWIWSSGVTPVSRVVIPHSGPLYGDNSPGGKTGTASCYLFQMDVKGSTCWISSRQAHGRTRLCPHTAKGKRNAALQPLISSSLSGNRKDQTVDTRAIFSITVNIILNFEQAKSALCHCNRWPVLSLISHQNPFVITP
jgi:hypothetical protein